MAARKNLLVELFVEELPPKALKKLGEEFAGALAESLKKQGLAASDAVATSFSTPRRLAAHVTGVADKADDRTVTQKLMPVSVGLDAAGKATQALLKKLQSLGVVSSLVEAHKQVGEGFKPSPTSSLSEAIALLKRQSDGKTEALFLDSTVEGATLAEGLQKALDEALAKLPIPKVMGYQLEDGWTTVNFVRPAHGLVALHGAAVVRVSALGLNAGRTTHGHRFEAAIDPIVLKDADSYAAQLETEGAVIASFAARRAEIQRQLEDAAAFENLKPIDDDALLDEVTALVERPNVLACHFDREFLDLPPEVLILTMKANQKYFPLLDAEGKLTDKFLVVSNISPADPSRVIEGNERVVRPRLADAKFFFDQDRKKTLESRVEGLSKVVYHNKLGTQGERVERIRNIAIDFATRLGDAKLVADASKASYIAKADLLTDMVGEFPELQGIMGRAYALNEKLGEEIAYAIEDHYKPRFAGDELPKNRTGLVIALADKIETIVGLFGIGQIPTGDKDPFALRRHALGIIRILIEKNLSLPLDFLLSRAVSAFNNQIKDESDAIEDFIYDRLEAMLREQGYRAHEISAVLTLHPQRLAEVPNLLNAVRQFSDLPEAPSLATANKRVSNILRKSDDFTQTRVVDKSLLYEPAEAALFEAITDIAPKANAAFESSDYTTSLRILAALKTPVDEFFDKVMVNTEKKELRDNRLSLLAKLYSTMNRVADLSKLAA